MALTDKEYIECDGVHCPKCETTDMKCGEMEFAEGRAYQDITCLGCGYMWADQYTLTGIVHND